ncbi:MAG: zinc-binding alcohol dehydrogenase family protein [Rhodocyclaceae bacterium]|nr:zinc-binding alcohol dehydrogenase family protein [Rhodocyclaceae bacterium]
MKAVAIRQCLPVDHPEALLDVELPDPAPGERDLLVQVHAVSVNPVDTKVRRHMPPEPGQLRVPGWDAAGVVRAVGAQVTRFRPGDRVWYAGSLDRPGSHAELQCVDERIVGPMPASLGFAEAAALPLTALTAWELLFDRLQVPRVAAPLAGHAPGTGNDDAQEAGPASGTLLVTGAAGGVGSMLLQLARALTGLTLVGTASRPQTRAWALAMGAQHVIDHAAGPLAQQVRSLGIGQVDYAASLTHTDAHFAQLADILAPQGRLGLIDDPAPLDIRLLKRKSISLHWEFMYTRPLFGTADVARQGEILGEVARLVDAGVLRSTLTEHYGPVCAANLLRAHALLESGRACGKVVLEGFGQEPPPGNP